MRTPVAPLAVPPAVPRGGVVAVVAPASPVDPGRLARGVQALEATGYEVRVGAHVLAVDRDRPWLAGTDAERASDLATAWCDPDVAAVVAARGGHGTSRLLPLLPWSALAEAGPCLLVGSSDLTSLHLAVHRRLRLATVFGPMLSAEAAVGEGADPATMAALLGALAAPQAPQRLGGRPGPVGGQTRGVLLGGTLALLAAAVGTAEAPDLGGAVLLLEDVGESPARLQRAVGQLASAGLLADLAGIAVGSVVDSGSMGPWALHDAVAPLGVPVVTDLPLGHGPVQAAALLGAVVRLDADAGVLHLGVPA